MWRKRRFALTALLFIFTMLAGYWCGYRLLPQTGLIRSIHQNRLLLPAALPFSGGFLEGAAEDTMLSGDSLGEILFNQSGLPTALTLALPATQQNQAERSFPLKGAPRLIVMEESSITAYATTEATVAQPRIAVYCTHSSEEYSDGKRVPGGRGGVHTVAQRLAEKLNALGLPAIYCDTVHDYPEWNLSYANSLQSIEALKATYPSLDMFIDVHRDSAADSILVNAGGNMARIMMVVGSNTRLPHTNWQQNQAFSEQIKQALETRTPGIMRGVIVQPGRYNQHISTKAILVEMGSTKNSTAEAITSAHLLAEAIAEVLSN